MAKIRILVVDDEEGMLEVCHDTLEELHDAELVLEDNSARAAVLLAREHWDLLITDLRMPEVDGVELLRMGRAHDPRLVVLMMTAFPTVETAVESLRLGAADYVTKPIIPEDLFKHVTRLLYQIRLERENDLLTRRLDHSFAFDDILGKTPVMRTMFDTVHKIAEADLDVLILGETGVGKELVARSIHKRSKRREGRFVPLDCGAIPENLLENEVFGHERGAFTGAHKQSMGLLEFADGGTFFLDEVAEMPLSLQAKLLRVLQERQFRRVGGQHEIDVNVRVIAATNGDIQAAIRQGTFREDFYYRINVARIEVPPLRQRIGDLPMLIEHFTSRFTREMDKPTMRIDPDVQDVLSRYPWPGNVRELQNVLKRSLAMCGDGCLRVDDLPDDVLIAASCREGAGKQGFFQLRESRVASFEKEYFSSLLMQTDGDIAKAARMAQIPRGTLYRLMKKCGLHADTFRRDKETPPGNP